MPMKLLPISAFTFENKHYLILEGMWNSLCLHIVCDKNNNSYDSFMGYTVNTGSKYGLSVRSDYVSLLLCFHLICSSYVFKVTVIFFHGPYYLIVSLQRKHKEEQTKFSFLFVLNRIAQCFLGTLNPLQNHWYYSTNVIPKA